MTCSVPAVLAVGVLLLSGCLSGGGAPTSHQCVISFEEETPSSTVEITQVVEDAGMIEIAYNTTEIVATVELIAGGNTIKTNNSMPPGSHSMSIPTAQLDTGTITLQASTPDGEIIADYRILTTNCTSNP
ncbi:hypothetical protein [Salarchaeum sp. JOR-1]|uniref:hypothetical protein n=1 Tax=Salarchaeum sp. JOR-1 TaxID=2599399 RepID=UPI001198C488|nr:hypothetical protein [Salarchaeum sp. JOR-1]QDX39485.1 hypothetical protein FQU85_00810 [Salarchaeum sp. JOR-1]